MRISWCLAGVWRSYWRSPLGSKKHGMPVACFGHAGDGNIHVNVMVDDTQVGHEQRRDAALDELFRWIVSTME